MLTIEKVRSVLQSNGIRITPQRMMIVQVLIEHAEHPTVEEIFDRVRATYPAISLATVYNTVGLLSRYGLIATIHGGKEGLRLDPNSTVHAHRHCTCCGSIHNVPIAVQVRLDELAYKDFAPEQLEVAVYGRCAACRCVDDLA